MPHEPIHPIIELTEQEAASVLSSWLDREVQVHAVRRLVGGCVNTVVRVDFDGDEVVVKLSRLVGDSKLDEECDVLKFFEQVPSFRVPRLLYRDISGRSVPYSFYIMEYLNGVNMADASSMLGAGDRMVIEREIAEAVVNLHELRREQFGPCTGDEQDRKWSACFGRRFDRTVAQIREKQLLEPNILEQVIEIKRAFCPLLDTAAAPALTHGDIWATNIILSPASGAWSLGGFVDPGGLFAHPEYELAYLDIWNTVGRTFHEIYRSYHPIEPGYELRRLFYWLHTLLIHVRAFQSDYYRSAAHQLIEQMIRMVRKGR